MDIMKMFEEYLPKWCEEKMQPMPVKEQADRWSVAWKDFTDTVLKEKYNEIAQEYKSMQLKTVGMLQQEKLKAKKPVVEEPVEEVVIEEEQTLSEWEKVQRMLNEN